MMEYKRLLQSEWFGKEDLLALQLEKLTTVVTAAYRTSEFYRRRFDEHGVRPEIIQSTDDLARFPILEKRDLPSLRDSLKRPRRFSSVTRKSAGTTGIPVVVLAETGANARSLAARYRSYRWYRIGPGERELRLWGRPLAHARWRHLLRARLLNRILVDGSSLSPGGFERLMAQIGCYGADYAYGYTSMVAMFAEQYARLPRHRQTLPLKAVICTAETSLRAERADLARQLRAPVVEEYGCSEIDIIAFECPSGGLHVVAENVLVELVYFGGEPSGYAEVVVTDLNNTTMPLIRYRLGDLASWASSACGCGRASPTLERVIGRAQGQYIIKTSGEQIHSQTIAYAFENMRERGLPIERFQIVQPDPGNLTVYIVATESSNVEREQILTIARKEVEELVGLGVTVAFRFVGFAELYRPNEKYRHFLSDIHNAPK